ncbi:TonB family protein [Aetokthonos hydrillicola Thurmond2011]|jgi:TonB family protein|uniref:TonB family protein n=1 Tax=Aetokthonos hydrillicola Thurmond2011 TaxID=2712845 RepID=A0AAP5I894_9CYAN|nr:energy transducer TonB [Aetokthonos hydrillicola]MBO3458841.1 TonB family protein [Aetokthonos hydrillicola CCALA 1050]MBW4587311.1 TonB family protein [Aetokthonos hydrillicola CCALA 1050]MDR9896666.1 TonB family protein [Aetokthonos hydrillicola Thurmond2011]
MTKSHILESYRYNRSEDLVFGVVASLLLHFIIFLGSIYWLRTFAREQKLGDSIPIEYVEVPPNQTTTPPETSRRATKDSVAGGKADPTKPLSVARSGGTSSLKPSGSRSAQGSPPELKQPTPPQKSQAAIAPSTATPRKTVQTAVRPNTILPNPKLSVKPTALPITKLRKIAPASTTTPPKSPETAVPPNPEPSVEPTTTQLISKLRKIATAPTTTPTKPQETEATPDTTPLTPKPSAEPSKTQLISKLRKIAVAPTTTLTKPQQTEATPSKPKPSVEPTTAPITKPQKIVAAPNTTAIKPEQAEAIHTSTPPKLKPSQTANTSTTTDPKPLAHNGNKTRVATKPTTSPLETRTSSRSQSQVHPSSKSGAASRLGGPVSVSTRDLGGNSLASVPNSNRFNQSESGIDARKDTGLATYLSHLQARVRKQWIPEFTDSSRKTVVRFTVDRSGAISNLALIQPSGFSGTDQAAFNAIKRAAPFGPLPTAYAQNYINIEFTFNINVYGQLDIQGGG